MLQKQENSHCDTVLIAHYTTSILEHCA